MYYKNGMFAHFSESCAEVVPLFCFCFSRSNVSFHASSLQSRHHQRNCVTSCARAVKRFTFTALYWQSIIARYSCAFPRHLSVNRATQVGWIRAPALPPLTLQQAQTKCATQYKQPRVFALCVFIDVDKRVRLQNSIACNQTGCAFSECMQEFAGLLRSERCRLIE